MASNNNSPTSDLDKWFSAARMSTYAHHPDPEALYLWNTHVTKAFLEDIQHVEVLLRNCVDTAVAPSYGARWYANPAIPFDQPVRKSIQKARRRAGTSRESMPPPGRVIAELSFDFLGLPVHQNLRLDSLAAVLLQTGFAPYLPTDREHCNASFTSAFSPEFPSLQQHLYWGVGAPSASRTLRAMACPRSGGTALPICFTICERFPLNTKSSSYDWSRAPSRGVSARSRSG